MKGRRLRTMTITLFIGKDILTVKFQACTNSVITKVIRVTFLAGAVKAG